jgi:mannose-1-phosphate guanylyltransferase
VVALLAGGKGTRFWPLSRAATPKQFLTLFSDRSLLRLTFERFRRTVPESDILVVTNAAHERRTREEIPELPAENLILEPSGRDTAPAAALAVRATRIPW